MPHYDDETFRRMFRVNTNTFEVLLDYLKTCADVQPAGPGGREPIPLEKQLLLTLWYVGGQDTINKIADRFDISESSVILCRNRIMRAFLNMRHTFITWSTRQEMLEEADKFSRRNGFPGIVGALDGTHISLKAPHQKPVIRKQERFSFCSTTVCKHNMMFSYAFTGYPGSCHDSSVLKISDLWSEGHVHG